MKKSLRKWGCALLTVIMLSSFGLSTYNPVAAQSEKYSSIITESAQPFSGEYDTVNYEKVTGNVDLTGVQFSNFNSSVYASDTFDKQTKYQPIISYVDTDTVRAKLFHWQLFGRWRCFLLLFSILDSTCFKLPLNPWPLQEVV